MQAQLVLENELIYTNCGDYSESFPHCDNRNLEDPLHCFTQRINGPGRLPACSLPHGMYILIM